MIISERQTEINQDSIKISIKTANQKLNKVIDKYAVHYISNLFDVNSNQHIIQIFNNSEFMIINQCPDKYHENHFFILGLEQTLLFIDQRLLFLLKPYFTSNTKLEIYFLPNTKNLFNKQVEIKNRQIEID